MSLLEILLWGAELAEVCPNSPPSPPSPPAMGANPSSPRQLQERSPSIWDTHLDGYGWRVDLALEAILTISAPSGLIVWLGDHSPYLYRRLTSDLPDEISLAWEARVPYGDFDALCREFIDTYRCAADYAHDSENEQSKQREAAENEGAR